MVDRGQRPNCVIGNEGTLPYLFVFHFDFRLEYFILILESVV